MSVDMLTSIVARCRLGELIENVEIPLISDLTNHSRLLQQVIIDICANRFALGIEMDFEIFPKTRRVVIAEGLCISERFEKRVRG